MATIFIIGLVLVSAITPFVARYLMQQEDAAKSKLGRMLDLSSSDYDD